VFTKIIAVATTALLAVLALELVFGVHIGFVRWLDEQLTFSVRLIS